MGPRHSLRDAVRHVGAALPMGSCLHTLYAFSDKNLDLTYNRVCWHVDLTVYLMRHLCVILSYIAQYSLLLPSIRVFPLFQWKCGLSATHLWQGALSPFT